MASITLDLSDEVTSALGELDQPLERSAVEVIVIELFRRGLISGGAAARTLDMPRLDFIRFAAELDIPYFNLTSEEWEAERQWVDSL